MTVSNTREPALRIPDHVVYRELDGALVLTSLAVGGFLRLDEVGRAIWTALAQGLDVDAVVAELTRTYDVAEERCRADVVSFISDLERRGLLAWGEAAR